MRTDWRVVSCGSCVNGLVSDYSGGDFNGPKECPECGGSGRLFVLPNDRIALYPGGPFRGTWTGAYANGVSLQEKAK